MTQVFSHNLFFYKSFAEIQFTYHTIYTLKAFSGLGHIHRVVQPSTQSILAQSAFWVFTL